MRPQVQYRRVVWKSAARAFLGSVSVFGLTTRAAQAAATTWIGPADGSWSGASNWSTGAVPQAADDVFIDAGQAQNSTVHLPSTTTINTLSISAGDRLRVGNLSDFSELQFGGTTLFNAGTIDVGIGGPQFAQITPIGASLELSGGGTVHLNRAQVRGSGRFSNIDNTIVIAFGSLGVFSPGMFNSGTIITTEPNTVSGIFSQTAVPFQNRGVMVATNSSGMALTGQNGKVFDNDGGTIRANGGFIQLDNGARVIGGTVGPGNCMIQAAESGAVEGIVNSANWTVDGTLVLVGTIINSGGFATTGRTNISGQVTLQGSGALTTEAAGRIGGSGTLINESNRIIGIGNLGDNAIAIENRAGGLIASRLGFNSNTLIVDPATATNLLNDGTLRGDRGTLALSGNGGGGFTNNGVIEAINGGRVVLTSGAQLTNLSAGRLTGGHYFVTSGSTIDFAGGSILTNAASIRLDGATPRFAALDALQDNEATIALTGGANLTSSSAFENAGMLSINGGSDLVASGFTQDDAATIQLQITGTCDEGYGQVQTNGIVSIDGALMITTTQNPPLQFDFVLIRGSSVGGTFDSVLLPPLPGGQNWDLQYRSDSVVLRAVPEPAAALMASFALTLGFRRRCRRSP